MSRVTIPNMRLRERSALQSLLVATAFTFVLSTGACSEEEDHPSAEPGTVERLQVDCEQVSLLRHGRRVRSRSRLSRDRA